MTNRKTKYNANWEKEHLWLTAVVQDVYTAFCKLCNKTFRIDGSGLSQVNSHACSNFHKKQVINFSTQRTFSTNADFVPYLFGDKLSHTDLVAKAEIIQALKFADSNYSFASASDDNARFAAMLHYTYVQRMLLVRKF